MKFKAKATFLSVQSQPYEMDGRSGVAYPLRVIAEGNLYKFRASKELYEAHSKLPELTPVEIELQIDSVKEANYVKVLSLTVLPK